jgi:beta-lactamase superfamily II metal-dependent hydrolase
MNPTGPLTIRMYNVGFGDCFLLTLPAAPGERPRRILIDCGKHKLSSTGPKLGRIVQQLLEDITDPDGQRRIDVVVATHRHLDHVQGFSMQTEAWAGTHVGEVWMPWTEDPDDPQARNICERQSRRAQRVRRNITALALDADQQEYLLGYAGNNLTNEAAMEMLHHGFIGAPPRRFFPSEKTPSSPYTTDLLPHVEVFVLGPPRSEAVLAEMDPPDAESFFAAWESTFAAPPEADPQQRPFAPQWSIDRATYEARLGTSLDVQFPATSEPYLGRSTDKTGLEIAARIEAAVNSTSLVLLFHIGSAWLLFPGDAQWGSWNAILQDPAAVAMLAKLSFYKVGHHGSHNATPVSFAKDFLTENVRVMLPVGPVRQWPTIPRQGLLDLLAERNIPLAVSDQAPSANEIFSTHTENGDVLFIDTEIPI